MKDESAALQRERRIALIRALQKEMIQYRGIAVPKEDEAQKRLLRSLMNVRPPVPAEKDFLALQDAYLTEETKRRGIVDCALLKPVHEGGRMYLWQGDITRLNADAVVNAANSALLGCFQPCHSCIDNVIHSFSGVQLRLACSDIITAQGHEEPTGTAKITPGFNLPCRYVLHTVGPIVSGALEENDCRLLARCYEACLRLAAENGVKSIAFCCISTGVFRFPPERAAKIAVETVSRFLKADDAVGQVIFDVFTDRDREIYERLLQQGDGGSAVS